MKAHEKVFWIRFCVYSTVVLLALALCAVTSEDIEYWKQRKGYGFDYDLP